MSEKAEEVGGWGCRRGWTRVNVLGQCGGRDGGNRKSSRGGHGGGRGERGCSQWAVVWRRVGADFSRGVLAWSTQGTVVCRRWLPKQSSSVTDQQAHAARSTRLHRRRGALRKRGGPASCDSLSLHAHALRRLAQREAQCFSLSPVGFLLASCHDGGGRQLGSRTPTLQPLATGSLLRHHHEAGGSSAHLIGYRSGVPAGGSHWAIASPPRCEWLASRLNRADGCWATTNAPVLG